MHEERSCGNGQRPYLIFLEKSLSALLRWYLGSLEVGKTYKNSSGANAG